MKQPILSPFNKYSIYKLSLLILSLSLSTKMVIAAPQDAKKDWPQWRGPNRDGIVPNSLPLSWSAAGPKRLWKSEPLPSMEDGGFGSVTVAGGKVYILVSWKSGFEGASERQDVIVCLEEGTGKTLWKVGYPGIGTDHASSSMPCVAENKVFVCGIERLYCLDAEKGTLLWKTGVIGKQISSSPLYLDGMVIVSANSLFAFDATTGKEFWHQDEAAGGPSFEGVPQTSNNCSPVVWFKNDINYIINCGTKLTCVKAKTGEVKWQAPGPGSASATPAICGDDVVINYGLGRGTYSYRMTPEKAEQIWRISKCDRGSTPVIFDGLVYAYGGGSYACYELTTGQEKWKQPFSGEISSPVVADGKVFGFYDGCAGIIVFKPTADKYTEIDRLSINACNATTPTIANGKLFIRAYDGIACYALTPAGHNLPLPELAALAGKPIRINVGSKTDWTDPNGNTWMADRFADDGTVFEWGDIPIQGTNLGRIYQSERRDVTGYTLNVANGDYTVRVHFCENYEGIPEDGLRVMTLDINGVVVRNIDPFGETGARGIPLVRQVSTSVTNGLLKIDLHAQKSETILNGLEIIPGRLPELETILWPKPQPQPKIPSTSPRDRGVAMAVGIIDIPGLADTYAQIKPEVWIAGLQNAKLADYKVAIKRLTTVEDLVSAMAHPETWLAILNPYGEQFVSAGPGRWQEMVASIRYYVRNGGNWWEMGGYPLYQAQYTKEGKMLSERVLEKGFRFLGLNVGPEGREGPVAITADARKVFDNETAAILTTFACSTNRGMPADSNHLTLLKAGDKDLLGGYQLGGWGWLWRFVATRHDADLYIPAARAILEYIYTHTPASLTTTAALHTAAISNPDKVPADVFPSLEEMKRNWPCFRGTGDGLAPSSNVPLRWDVSSWAGLLWKAVVPASGHSSPIVWGDRVFLSGGDKTSCAVFCFNAVSGDLMWQRTPDLPRPVGSNEWKVFESTGMASPTMVVNDHLAYAIFANGDLAAFDFDGKQIWAKNLGLPENPYGHASSLALWQNRLIVQFDQGLQDDHKARLYAFDSNTGQLIWEKQRPVGSSWSSPIIAEVAGKAHVLALATPWAIAYDIKDGSELWRFGNMSGEMVPSPIYSAGLFYIISPSETLYAINPVGNGDITKTNVVWSNDEWVPDICSPVSNGELLFTLTTSGTLSCFDAKNGKKQWEHDFQMEFRASPTISGNRLYLLENTGKVFVLEVNRQFKELARSDLSEPLDASPAFASDRIYIRSAKTLFCVGVK
jgi:outer membrane protein assembly factor BamB